MDRDDDLLKAYVSHPFRAYCVQLYEQETGAKNSMFLLLPVTQLVLGSGNRIQRIQPEYNRTQQTQRLLREREGMNTWISLVSHCVCTLCILYLLQPANKTSPQSAYESRNRTISALEPPQKHSSFVCTKIH